MTVKERYENKNAVNRELRHKQWDPQTFKTSQENIFQTSSKCAPRLTRKCSLFAIIICGFIVEYSVFDSLFHFVRMII